MANPAQYRVFLVLNLLLPKGVNIFVYDIGTDVSGSPSNDRRIEVNTDDGTLADWNRCQDSPAISSKKNQGVEVKATVGSSLKLLTSSVNDELCQISDNFSAAVCGADSTQLRKSSSERTRVSLRFLRFGISPSQSSGRINLEYRRFTDAELRLHCIMVCNRQNHTNHPRLQELPTAGFDHLESSRFALLVRLHNSTPKKMPMTCRQSSTAEELFSDMQSQGLTSWSPLETGVIVDVYFIITLCRSPIVNDSATESTEVVLKGEPKHRRYAPEHNPNSKFQSNVTAGATDSAMVFKTPKVRLFYHYPYWSKLFSSFHRHSLSPLEQNNDDKIILGSFLKLTYEIIILTIIIYKFLLDSFLKFIYEIITLLIIIYKFLSQNKEAETVDDSSVWLKIPTKTFFLEWNHAHKQNGKDPFKTEWHKLLKAGKTAEQTGSESLLKKTSMLNTLSEFILRPWLPKAQSEDAGSCPNSSGSNKCISFDTSLCSSCCRHLVHFRSHSQHTAQVYPVTRFLPNPTYDPALDLAHVGYRLATLSALPASVPVSRIRLADAGFYFRGQDDEVICYRCGTRHSGWTREDNPMEIHRRLSPNCEHMLQRDRELSALARSSNLGGGGQGCAALGAGVNTPVENGQGSHSPTQQPTTASRETSTPPSNRPVVCNGAGSSHSPACRGDLVTGSAATRGRGARESFPNTGTGHANPGTHPGTASGPGNRTGNIPNTVSTTTSTATSSTASSGVSVVSDGSSRRTSSAAFNASSSPRSGGGGGGQGNAAAARAETRPLFPRARLDLGGAVYPMYQDMASRRRTFSNWDDSQAPPLDHVILCGMFYAGYADCVRCFYCGMGLKHWVATDDVWTEHVRWRPSCEYLRAVKGDAFIRDTQRSLGIESPRGQGNSSLQGTDVPHVVRNDNFARPAPAQGQQPTTTSSTSTNTAVNTSTTTTAVATTSSVPAASPASLTAATAISTGQAGATATLSAAATTASTSSSPLRRGDNHTKARGDESGGAERGASVTVVSSAAEDSERLARLQAENRALSQRFQCRVCHQAAIDTILLPCGHLVVCETCARTVTSCPLCQNAIRATARVHME